MGGGKKHKGQQSQSTSRKQQQAKKQVAQFDEIFDSADTGFEQMYGVSQKEILMFVLAAIVLPAISVALCLKTGVHPFDIFYPADQSFLSPQKRDSPDLDNVVLNDKRVTTCDDDIVSHNVLLGGSNLGLGGSGQQHRQTKTGAGGLGGSDSSHAYDPAIRAHVNVELSEPKVQPSLCKDGETMGFSDWNTLQAAVQEANFLSAEKFLRWNEYYSSIAGQEFGAFEDDSMYYEEDTILTICPGVSLKSRRGPLFINAETIILECKYCVMHAHGTHLAFGPHAKNVLVRGITFRGAHTSSLTFHHDGAHASFEDCFWIGNVGNGKVGAVADVNTTSSVSFYRCEIADTKLAPRTGQKTQGMVSSLTIRGPQQGTAF